MCYILSIERQLRFLHSPLKEVKKKKEAAYEQLSLIRHSIREPGEGRAQ